MSLWGDLNNLHRACGMVWNPLERLSGLSYSLKAEDSLKQAASVSLSVTLKSAALNVMTASAPQLYHRWTKWEEEGVHCFKLMCVLTNILWCTVYCAVCSEVLLFFILLCMNHASKLEKLLNSLWCARRRNIRSVLLFVSFIYSSRSYCRAAPLLLFLLVSPVQPDLLASCLYAPHRTNAAFHSLNWQLSFSTSSLLWP